MKLLSSSIMALVMGGSFASAAPELIQGEVELVKSELVPPSIHVTEQRRTNNPLEDLLELPMCADHQTTAQAFLISVLARIADVGGLDDNCEHMKAIILPQLQNCVLETVGAPITVYAGAVFDAGVIFSHSSVRGVYIDNKGRYGCFKNTCSGFGLNLNIGIGAVGGILIGDAANDFPGRAFGVEVGGDLGTGIDFAGGTTSGGVPYAEISLGVGAGFAAGIQDCTAETYGRVDPTTPWIIEESQHCGGSDVSPLADGTVYGWGPPSKDIAQCEAKCEADNECNAFVWVNDKCYWKSGVTATTPYDRPNHDCHWLADWIDMPGMHCGGVTIDNLDDGTPYAWSPPSGDVAHCKTKCGADSQCVGFVWREDGKCFWKKDASPKTINYFLTHTCYFPAGAFTDDSQPTPSPPSTPVSSPVSPPAQDPDMATPGPIDPFDLRRRIRRLQ